MGDASGEDPGGWDDARFNRVLRFCLDGPRH